MAMAIYDDQNGAPVVKTRCAQQRCDMPKAIFLVFSNPSDPSRDGEFNHWYDTVHVPAARNAVTGLTKVTRYRLSDTQYAPPSQPREHRYLALYEVEAEDLALVRMQLEEMLEDVDHAHATDWSRAVGLVFEPITERRVPGQPSTDS
jgi:hypothetical protein